MPRREIDRLDDHEVAGEPHQAVGVARRLVQIHHVALCRCQRVQCEMRAAAQPLIGAHRAEYGAVGEGPMVGDFELDPVGHSRASPRAAGGNSARSCGPRQPRRSAAARMVVGCGKRRGIASNPTRGRRPLAPSKGSPLQSKFFGAGRARDRLGPNEHHDRPSPRPKHIWFQGRALGGDARGSAPCWGFGGNAPDPCPHPPPARMRGTGCECPLSRWRARLRPLTV